MSILLDRHTRVIIQDITGRLGSYHFVSRSGTVSYQTAAALTREGIGQSTCVGIGGDPISGISFSRVLDLFEQDPETELILLVGEIGGTAEEEAAVHAKVHISKPVLSLILGATAPPDKQMGHAGAIVTAGRGTHASKLRAMAEADIPVARTATELASMVRERLS